MEQPDAYISFRVEVQQLASAKTERSVKLDTPENTISSNGHMRANSQTPASETFSEQKHEINKIMTSCSLHLKEKFTPEWPFIFFTAIKSCAKFEVNKHQSATSMKKTI